MMMLENENITLRPFQQSDAAQIATLCNNKNVSDNLRDMIPFPYQLSDAEFFIGLCQQENPQTTFAIVADGTVVGCVGLVLQSDIYRLNAELGYWIGEPYWGKGIATKAVSLLVEYGFGQLGLERIYSGVFQTNKASQRVLEKAGFKLDCVFERSVVKNGQILNECRYSKLK
jgi:[ribosomal protein S5]-alanine N-acetyltransferase